MLAGAEVQAGRLQHQSTPYLPLGQQSDASLTALQQQHTAELISAVDAYLQHKTAASQPVNTVSEDMLAAVQQRGLVQMIREVTYYLKQDTKCMQQTVQELRAAQL